MKTLIELSGNKVAIVEYYLQSLADSLNGKKYDDLIPCNYRIEKVVIMNYTTGERFILEPSDVILIADEIRVTSSMKKEIPLSELV